MNIVFVLYNQWEKSLKHNRAGYVRNKAYTIPISVQPEVFYSSYSTEI